MSSPTKRIKTEDDEGGSGGKSKRIKQEDTDDNNNNSGGNGGGGGSSGGGGGGGGGGGESDDGSSASGAGSSSRQRPSLREGSANRPSNLVLVGKILDLPPPEFQESSFGKRLKVAVRTWMVDLYRANEWWIELANVDDVVDEHRRKIMVRGICNGFMFQPEVPISSLSSVANGRHGSACLQGINLLFYSDTPSDEDVSSVPSSGWDMISGTPPAWFAASWNQDDAGLQLADEFKGAKVYVTQNQVLNEHREWLD